MFDGIHRGHAALLRRVVRRARALGLPSVVIGFDPPPIAILAPQAPPYRLTRRETALRRFAELGLDRAWLLRFSRRMAELQPDAFVRYLGEHLELAELWVGYDFRFGKARRGGIEELRAMGADRGFDVHRFAELTEDGRAVSSSWVREALRAGEVETAERLLGHSFTLEGPVVHGDGLGARKLVATANVSLPPEQLLPAIGVYAAWGELAGALIPAAVNIGRRPTLTPAGRVIVEAHLIGWEGDLYGRRLILHIGRRLRDEARFDGMAALREAILRDIDQAAGWLRGRTPPQGTLEDPEELPGNG